MTEKGLKYLYDIHAYDAVDASMIWAIIRNHLTPLKQEIN